MIGLCSGLGLAAVMVAAMLVVRAWVSRQLFAILNASRIFTSVSALQAMPLAINSPARLTSLLLYSK